ncbi:GxxExxY protein [Geothrix paludis]|uniref:GxxExxY protein n=1 Tax=Geothrix paludis TaxID=2922722 RepID=UPI001FABF781|nr:GxxExxY protein [Geothrix paludis]
MQEHDPLTERIIGCAFKVANTLGHGFLEKVYENALAHELRKAGLEVIQQHGLEVHYDGALVGEFQVDLLVEGRVLVELKAVAGILDAHMAQSLNYLKASGKPVCLLLNFGPSLQVRRLVHGG